MERTLPPITLAEMGKQSESVGMTHSKSVPITVGKGPTFYIQSEEMSIDQMKKRLAVLKPPEVEIRGDTAVPYGVITDVLRICQENGISTVALTYKTQKESATQ